MSHIFETLNSADQRARADSDRVESPEKTVRRVSAHLGKFGVTRLAEITGLDDLGIPVWSAVRPNARSLSVSAGKGLDDAAATASALMEAVEYSIAEEALPDIEQRTRNEINQDDSLLEGVALDPEGIARCSLRIFDGDPKLNWGKGEDLTTGETIWVPWPLVTLDKRIDQGPEIVNEAVHRASTGLGCGNTQDEAVFHALCECVEEDAIAQWRLRGGDWARFVPPEIFGSADVDDLVARIRRSGARIRLIDITTRDLEVPAYLAFIGPPDKQDKHSGVFSQSISSGAGCHPDPVRAVLRAITEAAQSRLVLIAGARDDLQPKNYAWVTGDQASAIADLFNAPDAVFEAPQPNGFPQTGVLSEKIDWLLERLQAADAGPAISVPIETPASRAAGAYGVRVIVAGLDVDPTTGGKQMTVRGLSVFLEHAHIPAMESVSA